VPREDYDAERVRSVVSAWRELRAHYERVGSVEDDEWAEVLDVERALGALGNYVLRNRPADAYTDDAVPRLKAGGEYHRRRQFDRLATASAATLACQMLLGWRAADVRFLLPKGPDMTPEVLERKAVAWMASYLGGGSFPECDRAFEEAR
jgi:hypothetical protein